MFRRYLFTSLRTTLYFQQPTKTKGYICKLLVALRQKRFDLNTKELQQHKTQTFIKICKYNISLNQ